MPNRIGLLDLEYKITQLYMGEAEKASEAMLSEGKVRESIVEVGKELDIFDLAVSDGKMSLDGVFTVKATWNRKTEIRRGAGLEVSWNALAVHMLPLGERIIVEFNDGGLELLKEQWANQEFLKRVFRVAYNDPKLERG
ncbi:hypothetical protein HYS94_01040 [Candidatus Daviesbacteria bacterium]|nr:hypothetical protein [Candidatus Daviesbacteria bacterium]